MGNRQIRQIIQRPRSIIDVAAFFHLLTCGTHAARSSGILFSNVQHAKCDGVMYKISTAAKFELVVNSFAICLDRPFTDPEFLRDRFSGKSLRDCPENLSLAHTKTFRVGLAGRATISA
jgi:hypothetical protein